MTLVNSDGGALEGDVYAELAFWTRTDGRGKAFGPSASFTLPATSSRATLPSLPSSSSRSVPRATGLPTLEAKMQTWIANDVQLVWLIDPERKVAAIYRHGDSAEVLHGPTSVQGTGPVAGFELVMSLIWQ